MRILLVNKYAYVTGGADRHVIELAEGLASAGHDIRVLSTLHHDNSHLAGVFVPPIVSLESKMTLSRSTQIGVASASIWNRRAFVAMQQLIDEFKPHIIHSHKLFPQLSISPILCATRLGVPVVQTVHDFEFVAAHPLDPLCRKIDRASERRSFRVLNSIGLFARQRLHTPRVTEWITPSEAIAHVYDSQGIVSTVVRNFVITNVEHRRMYSDRDGVVFVGRLAEDKGILEVLDLARAMPAMRFTIAGWGPLEPEVVQAHLQLENLDFVGRVGADHVADLLSRSRIVVMPSRWETGPLVALEAMAVGTPVIAYPHGGLGEYVDIANSGVLVPDSASLHQACVTLIRDAALWEQHSLAGWTAARTRFSRDRYLDSVYSIYEAAITARSWPGTRRGIGR